LARSRAVGVLPIATHGQHTSNSADACRPPSRPVVRHRRLLGRLEAAAPPAPAPVVQTVPEGKFTAEFPGAPVYKPETVSAAGHDLVMHTYEVEAANQYVVVSYTDYPKGVTTSLEGAAQGSAAAVNGTIQSKVETTFMGHPAIDLVVNAPDGVIHARLVLRERRLYTVMGVAETGKAASYDRLLETFVLL
jgi:hypothetical protein